MISYYLVGGATSNRRKEGNRSIDLHARRNIVSIDSFSRWYDPHKRVGLYVAEWAMLELSIPDVS